MLTHPSGTQDLGFRRDVLHNVTQEMVVNTTFKKSTLLFEWVEMEIATMVILIELVDPKAEVLRGVIPCENEGF